MHTLAAQGNTGSRRCFGVSLSVDETDALSTQLAQGFDALNAGFASAIESARQRIVTDRGRLAGYAPAKSHFLIATGAKATRATGGLSLLEDCGLPGVNKFGNFLDDFLTNQVSANNIPFVGCGISTLRTLDRKSVV